MLGLTVAAVIAAAPMGMSPEGCSGQGRIIGERCRPLGKGQDFP